MSKRVVHPALSCPDITVTHDGVIFPRERQAMIDAEAIALRMAGDMQARIRAAQYLDLADLTKDGWTLDQIEQHWVAAFALKGSPLPPVRVSLDAPVGLFEVKPRAGEEVIAQSLDDLPVAATESADKRRLFHLAAHCPRNDERALSVPPQNFIDGDNQQMDQSLGRGGGVFECGQFHWNGSRWAGCLNFDPTQPCVKSGATTLGREIIEQTASVIALSVFLGVLFVVAA